MRRIAVVVGLACLLGACDSSRDVAPEKVTPASMSLDASNSLLVAARGANAIVPLRLTRGGGYLGAVSLTVSSLPAGVSAVFSRTALVPATDTSTLSLEVDPTATTGEFHVVVHAVGEAGLRDSATLTLIIPTPMISLSIASPSQDVLSGGFIPAFAVTLTRLNGFVGPVTLTTSAPASITAQMQPPTIPVGGVTSNLSITSQDGAVNGPVIVQVTATGAGVAPASVSYVASITSRAKLFATESRPSVIAGGRVQQRVSVERHGSFDRSIVLSISGLPAGITGSFSSTVISNTQSLTDVTLTVDAGASVAAGVYPFQITSAFQGLEADAYSVTLMLTVVRP